MLPMPATAILMAWTVLVWALWLAGGPVQRAVELVPHALRLVPPWPHAGEALGAAVRGALGAAATALTLTIAGGVVLRVLRCRPPSSVRVWLAAGAGLPVVGLGAQALGLTGLFHPELLALVAIAVCGWRALGAVRGRTRRKAPAPAPDSTGLRWIVRACAAIVGLSALAPEVAWDALAYHLHAPEQWSLAHRVTAPWGVMQAFFPFSGQMAMAVASSLGGERAAKLLHAAAWAGCVAVAGRLGAGWGGSRAGPWAAALFAASPLDMVVGCRAYVEYFMVLPLLGAGWIVAGGQRRPGSAAAVAAGWLTGAALGCKYQAAPAALVIGGALLRRARRPREATMWFAVAAACAAAAWGVRTYLWTGNPVFPAGIGGARFTAEDLAGIEGDAAAFRDRLGALRSLPRRALGEGEADGGWSPALLALLALPLVLRGVRSIPGWTWAGLLAALWWWTSPVPRYFAAGHAFLCVAAGAAIGGTALPRRVGAWLRPATIAGLWLSTVAGLAAIWHGTEPFGAAVGAWTDAEYRARRIEPAGWVETTAALGDLVPPGRRAYLMGHAFALGMRCRTWTDLPYLRPHLHWWVRGAVDEHRVLARARQAGLTHLAHNPAGARMIFADRAAGVGWTADSLSAWNAFWRRHVRRVAVAGPWRIYRIDRTPGDHRPWPGPVPGTEGVRGAASGSRSPAAP